jgi:hypothetical protein
VDLEAWEAVPLSQEEERTGCGDSGESVQSYAVRPAVVANVYYTAIGLVAGLLAIHSCACRVLVVRCRGLVILFGVPKGTLGQQ